MGILAFVFLVCYLGIYGSPNLFEMVLPKQNSENFVSSAMPLKGDILQTSK